MPGRNPQDLALTTKGVAARLGLGPATRPRRSNSFTTALNPRCVEPAIRRNSAAMSSSTVNVVLMIGIMMFIINDVKMYGGSNDSSNDSEMTAAVEDARPPKRRWGA